jgi:hypothetical protein
MLQNRLWEVNHLKLGNFEPKAPFNYQNPFPARTVAFAASTNPYGCAVSTQASSGSCFGGCVCLGGLPHKKSAFDLKENSRKSKSSHYVECAMANQTTNIAGMVFRTLRCVRRGSRILSVGHLLHPLCVCRREARFYW